METIKIKIERSADHFGAYAENCVGIYGGGDTAEEAKANALEGLKLFLETCPPDRLPAILKGEYEIVFK